MERDFSCELAQLFVLSVNTPSLDQELTAASVIARVLTISSSSV